jgi:putative methionine-R-sulfoxide reductase with GAF domain
MLSRDIKLVITIFSAGYHLKTQILDSRKLTSQIELLLADKPAPGKDTALEQVIDLLYRQRGYSSIGIYAVLGDRILGLAYRGPALPCLEVAMGKGPIGAVVQSGQMSVSQLQLQFEGADSRVQSEVVVPIRMASRVLGAIDVESGRPDALGYHDQVLLRQVAALLAQYLTSHGKFLIQKLRMQSQAAGEGAGVQHKKAAPAPDRPAGAVAHKATVGEMLQA